MRKKATTSVLPYLREKEKQAQREAKPQEDKLHSFEKTSEPSDGNLSEYDKARMAILRGEE